MEGQVVLAEKQHSVKPFIGPIQIVIEEVIGIRGMYEEVMVLFEEVSVEGVRFTSSADMPISDIIDFRLPSLCSGSLLLGKIMWKKNAGAGKYQYGLKIIHGW